MARETFSSASRTIFDKKGQMLGKTREAMVVTGNRTVRSATSREVDQRYDHPGYIRGVRSLEKRRIR